MFVVGGVLLLTLGVAAWPIPGLYLAPYNSRPTSPTSPTSHVATDINFESCIGPDLTDIEELRRELLSQISEDERRGDISTISFGLLESDWERLRQLETNLPNDSKIKAKLVKAFRLLIAALYQVHVKGKKLVKEEEPVTSGIDIYEISLSKYRDAVSAKSRPYSDVTDSTSTSFSNDTDNTSRSISSDTDNTSRSISNDTDNTSRSISNDTDNTSRSISNDTDNEADGSNNEEKSFPYTSSSPDQGPLMIDLLVSTVNPNLTTTDLPELPSHVTPSSTVKSDQTVIIFIDGEDLFSDGASTVGTVNDAKLQSQASSKLSSSVQIANLSGEVDNTNERTMTIPMMKPSTSSPSERVKGNILYVGTTRLPSTEQDGVGGETKVSEIINKSQTLTDFSVGPTNDIVSQTTSRANKLHTPNPIIVLNSTSIDLLATEEDNDYFSSETTTNPTNTVDVNSRETSQMDENNHIAVSNANDISVDKAPSVTFKSESDNDDIRTSEVTDNVFSDSRPVSQDKWSTESIVNSVINNKNDKLNESKYIDLLDTSRKLDEDHLIKKGKLPPEEESKIVVTPTTISADNNKPSVNSNTLFPLNKTELQISDDNTEKPSSYSPEITTVEKLFEGKKNEIANNKLSTPTNNRPRTGDDYVYTTDTVTTPKDSTSLYRVAFIPTPKYRHENDNLNTIDDSGFNGKNDLVRENNASIEHSHKVKGTSETPHATYPTSSSSTLSTTRGDSEPNYFDNSIYDTDGNEDYGRKYVFTQPLEKDKSPHRLQPTTVKPKETFRYFTVLFEKEPERKVQLTPINILRIFPKGPYRPHYEIGPSEGCIDNNNDCVRVGNVQYQYLDTIKDTRSSTGRMLPNGQYLNQLQPDYADFYLRVKKHTSTNEKRNV